ncbi:hypothetical protein [Jatrophihabitans sp.]|uniref:hypothetical protein n=1 Tax=Jatrophihabitans sp. TaxID=1932789 RepID=UPI0030C74D9D|nr:hypothetical protein [Jatrophihabitans sp.]
MTGYSATQFVGLPLDQALSLAQELGWTVRNRTEYPTATAELRSNRVDVWVDDTGTVVRAENAWDDRPVPPVS